jgi:hypothetical protein
VAKTMTVEEARTQFEYWSSPLINSSRREELKALYGRLSAAAAMSGGVQAQQEMREALRDAVLATSRGVRRDKFR